MTVFIRTFLFSSAGTPNAASVIISKGSYGCSFNKHTAGNIYHITLQIRSNQFVYRTCKAQNVV